jgi:hypothetical protein
MHSRVVTLKNFFLFTFIVVVVQTLAGSVAGKVEETKLHSIFVEKFLNIHYAEAPE